MRSKREEEKKKSRKAGKKKRTPERRNEDGRDKRFGYVVAFVMLICRKNGQQKESDRERVQWWGSDLPLPVPSMIQRGLCDKRSAKENIAIPNIHQRKIRTDDFGECIANKLQHVWTNLIYFRLGIFKLVYSSWSCEIRSLI